MVSLYHSDWHDFVNRRFDVLTRMLGWLPGYRICAHEIREVLPSPAADAIWTALNRLAQNLRGWMRSTPRFGDCENLLFCI